MTDPWNLRRRISLMRCSIESTSIYSKSYRVSLQRPSMKTKHSKKQNRNTVTTGCLKSLIWAENLPCVPALPFCNGASSYWLTYQFITEKLYSIMPNSMCDERTGSRMTFLNSKLRNQTNAQTIIEQIQIKLWYARGVCNLLSFYGFPSVF
jgi:hypothetical protein